MPAVTRKGDIDSGHGCFPARPNNEGSPDVFINGIAAHRVGDGWETHCCFSGDTKFLINGEYVTFSYVYDHSDEFVGAKTMCYSIEHESFVEVDILQIIKAKTNVLIEILLENGSIVTCTLDHEFILKDGTRKQAQYLTHADELMEFI